MDDLELATRRRRATLIVVVVVAVVALAAYAFVPRTIASGGAGDDSWRLRVAPVAFGGQIALHHAGARATAGDHGVSLDPGLDQTVVWHVGGGEAASTVIVGPTPRGAASVRVTTDEHGVGEAAFRRAGWRRFHVEQLPGHVQVTELVAIGGGGEVREVLAEPPAPVALP